MPNSRGKLAGRLVKFFSFQSKSASGTDGSPNGEAEPGLRTASIQSSSEWRPTHRGSAEAARTEARASVDRVPSSRSRPPIPLWTQEGSGRLQQPQSSGSLPGSSRRLSAADPRQPPPVNGYQHQNKDPNRPLAEGLKRQPSDPRPLANGHRSQQGLDRNGGSVRDSYTGPGSAAQADAVSSAGAPQHGDQDLLTASEVMPPARSTENSLSSSIGGMQSPAEALEDIIMRLQSGTIEGRSVAAEKLFSCAAEHEPARARVASPPVVQALVRLLYDGRERGRMYAAYALSSVMTPDADLLSMQAAGVVPALISVLNTSRVLASKKGAMRALGRLARSDEAATEIATTQGIPPIIALLDCADPGLVRRCLVALYFVGADKPALQGALVAAGAVPPVVRLCHSTQREVQAEAVDVLKVLARHQRASRVIVDLDGLDVLNILALRALTPRAKTSAIKAIQRLANMQDLAALVRASPAAQFLNPDTVALYGSRDVSGALDPEITPSAAEPVAIPIPVERPAPPEPVPALLTPGTPPAPATMRAPMSRTENSEGVAESLSEMLHSGAVQEQIYAARALANFATQPASHEHILAAGAAESLASILCSGSTPAAMTAAASALGQLAKGCTEPGPMTSPAVIAALVYGLATPTLACHLPTASALQHLLLVDQSICQYIIDSSGLVVLVRRSSRGSMNVRLTALALLRDLGQLGLNMSGAVPVLTVLERSQTAEVRQLASNILVRLTGNSSGAHLTSGQRTLQNNVTLLVNSLRVTVSLPGELEEAMRMVPRSAFLPSSQEQEAWLAKPVMAAGGPPIVLGSPQAEMLALQALAPEAGHDVLDVGSGSGYFTMLAAHLVGESGAVSGIELRESAVEYAQACVSGVREARGLGDLCIVFLCGSVFGHAALEDRRFDRIYVGASCPKLRLRNLLRLLKQGGRMVVACEGQLLLLTQPADGGPVPEPTVLGALPAMDALVDDALQVLPSTSTSSSLTGHTASAGPNGSAYASPGDTCEASSRPATNGPRLGPAGPPNGQPGSTWQSNGDSRPSQPSGARSAGSRSAEDDDTFHPADDTHTWFISREDIRICRTAEGKKCRLGEGGFGVVYKALMNGVDEVAVKLVKAERPSAKEMARFHKEVRIMRKLHHRNMVQFYGACLEPGALFFVTELMKGGDLYSALRGHPETMHWDRLGRKVALDVALGINYLHTRRPPLAHRDLKSPNVLLSEEGVAKIADVGMVRAQVQELVTAQPVMTPLWAAPEVVRHERASIKADIWSYGVLIWELISGQDITELQPLAIARQMQGSQQGPTLELPMLSPPVAAHLFLECTQMDPELRPSAAKIVEWLRNA